MQSAMHCRERAEQCRRLAQEITTRDDPAIKSILALAREWDEKATAIDTSRATDHLRTASNEDAE
jgi:hypothetical protein